MKGQENVGDSRLYLLDTSAIFCLKDNEDGAFKVEKILDNAKKRHSRVLVSFMTLMEYLYICMMRYGEECARQDYLQLTLLPIEIVESDEESRVVAAELKAGHNISVADAWIAATAKIMNAVLVHRDPEYKSLSSIVKCLELPYK